MHPIGVNRYAELIGNNKKYWIKSQYDNKMMIFDMIIEKMNDSEKYYIKGKPGTLKDFFAGGGKIGR